MTTLPSEVKAALRRQVNDILATTLTTSVVYRNMVAMEVTIHGIDEAIDKLWAALQPEIERLMVEAYKKGHIDGQLSKI